MCDAACGATDAASSSASASDAAAGPISWTSATTSAKNRRRSGRTGIERIVTSRGATRTRANAVLTRRTRRTLRPDRAENGVRLAGMCRRFGIPSSSVPSTVRCYIRPMQSRWRRAVATVIGVWFTLSVSGVALQLCPLHGMQMAAGAHQAGTDCDRTSTHGPGYAGSPAQHGSQHGSQHGNSHDDCTCTGMCCVTATVTLAAAPIVPAPVVVAEAPVMAPVATRELAPRAAPDVTLPPPLGPPTLRA